jgi:6-phosphogluconolactonase (cycloisomerase 2 family)
MLSGLQPRRARAAGVIALALAAAACGGVRSCAAPPAPKGHYLYVVHDPGGGQPAPGADPRIAALRIDPASGVLTPIASMAAEAVGAWALAVDPSGRWFSLTGSQLGVQRIAASGALEHVATPGSGGLASAFDARGHYYFLVTGRGLEVHAFDARRGPDTGPALHVEAGVMPFKLATSADGGTLYAVDGQVLRVYTVGDRGRLAAVDGSPVDLGVRGLELAVHPSGRFLVVLGEVGSTRRLAVLSVSETGAIEPVAGSPFDVGQRVRGMAIAGDGARLFVSDDDRHTIETLALDASGALHRVASTPVPGKDLATLIVDASSRFLYGTALGQAVVFGWTIEPDGGLAPIAGTPLTLEGKAVDLATTPWLDGQRQAAALPAASSFGAEPEPVDLAHPLPADTDLSRILTALADPSDETRLTAMAALPRVTDLTPALPALVAALDDRGPGVSLRARLLLGPWALQHPGTVDDAVLDQIVNGKTGRGMGLDNASLCALHALVARGGVASPYLARTLVQSNQLRGEAMSALSSLGPAAKPAVPELIRLLGNGEATRYAVEVLGDIGPDAEAAVPELYGLLGHRSRLVSEAARRAIEKIRRGSAD